MPMLTNSAPVTVPCETCAHKDLCKYAENMRKLSMEPRYDLPYLEITISCEKYVTSSEVQYVG